MHYCSRCLVLSIWSVVDGDHSWRFDQMQDLLRMRRFLFVDEPCKHDPDNIMPTRARSPDHEGQTTRPGRRARSLQTPTREGVEEEDEQCSEAGSEGVDSVHAEEEPEVQYSFDDEDPEDYPFHEDVPVTQQRLRSQNERDVNLSSEQKKRFLRSGRATDAWVKDWVQEQVQRCSTYELDLVQFRVNWSIGA